MKIENVEIRVVKQEEGKKVVGSEVFVSCGKPYINFGFHVGGDAGIEPGTYSLNFTGETPKAAEGK